MSWLLRLKRKHKDFLKSISNSHTSLYTPIFPSKTIPDQNEQNVSIPAFRPKRRKNHSLWGGTYLYCLFKGVAPRQAETYMTRNIQQHRTYQYLKDIRHGFQTALVFFKYLKDSRHGFQTFFLFFFQMFCNSDIVAKRRDHWPLMWNVRELCLKTDMKRSPLTVPLLNASD